MAFVKSIALLTDLPESANLTLRVFRLFFDTINPATQSKNVELLMLDVLQQLIDENNISLPPRVVEIILAQFQRSQMARLTNIEYPPAHAMAKQLCIACSEHLSRHFASYFSDVLIRSAENEADLVNLTKAHNLLFELWLCSPQLILPLLPLLKEQLLLDNYQYRSIAVKTIGRMLGSVGVGGYSLTRLGAEWMSLWDAWLKRVDDRDEHVRIAWLECAPDIIDVNVDVCTDVVDRVTLFLVNPEDKLRLQATKALSNLSLNSVYDRVPLSTLHALAERVKDKKPGIRKYGIEAIGHIYYLHRRESKKPSLEEARTAFLDSIPSILLSLVYINDKQSYIYLSYILPKYIFPGSGPKEEISVANSMCSIYSLLDVKSKLAFITYVGRCERISAMLKICITQWRTGEQTSKFQRVLEMLVNTIFVDTSKAQDDISKFSTERHVLKTVELLLQPTTSLAAANDAEKDVLKRLPETVTATMEIILRASGFWIIRSKIFETIISSFNELLSSSLIKVVQLV